MTWLGFLAIALVQTPLIAQLSETELESLNSQAISFFNQANGLVKTDPLKAYEFYDKAIVRYQKISDAGGVKNVYLYYNIANAYLLKHDIGRAILNYRRAEKLDPAYTDLIKNLNYARLQRKDHIPITTEKKILHTLFFWHYDLGQKVKFIATTSLWVSLCLIISTSLWSRKRRFAKRLTILFATAMIAISISLTIDMIHADRNVQGVILAESVVVRQGDSESYPPSLEQPLHSGTEFKVIEQRPQWLHMELTNGHKAWIHRTHVELI